MVDNFRIVIFSLSQSMRYFPAKRKPSAPGFSILEVLAAAVVLLVILGLAVGMMGNVSELASRQRSRSAAFEGANAAFDTLTRSLEQATLNTHWGYERNAGGHPTAFRRESELHFVLGRTADLLGQPADRFPGMAVFFQSPEGRSALPDLKRLPSLLNGRGFFAMFGPAPDVPAVLQTVVPARHRFRLMEWQEPVEQLQVYQGGTGNGWFAGQVVSGGQLQNAAVLAENVVSVIILAEYPISATASEQSYVYDSRDEAAPIRRHQLPPKARVLMLTISEASAARLEEKYGANPPPLAPAAGLFVTPSKFLDDVGQWELALKAVTPRLDYQLFNAEISIRSAKWSL